MKRLLFLLALVAVAFQPSHAAPVVAGFVSVHGGFTYSGGPQNSSGTTPATSTKPSPKTTGFPSGPFPTGTGPTCVNNPHGINPCIIVTPDCGTSYTNYQVVSPAVIYYTDSSYYDYAPAQAAPTSPALPVVVVDAQGYIHSPYSNSVLKLTHAVNGQTVHDPINGKVFLVQIAGAARVTTPIRQID